MTTVVSRTGAKCGLVQIWGVLCGFGGRFIRSNLALNLPPNPHKPPPNLRLLGPLFVRVYIPSSLWAKAATGWQPHCDVWSGPCHGTVSRIHAPARRLRRHLLGVAPGFTQCAHQEATAQNNHRLGYVLLAA
jgi:hypothetical protein